MVLAAAGAAHHPPGPSISISQTVFPFGKCSHSIPRRERWSGGQRREGQQHNENIIFDLFLNRTHLFQSPTHRRCRCRCFCRCLSRSRSQRRGSFLELGSMRSRTIHGDPREERPTTAAGCRPRRSAASCLLLLCVSFVTSSTCMRRYTEQKGILTWGFGEISKHKF